MLEECKSNLDINANIDVVVQSYICSPALLGVIKPKIVLPHYVINNPNSDSTFHDNDLNYILLHELAHYKRGDMLINYLLIALTAIYWFNDLTWVFFKFIRQDMEFANDAYVLRTIGNEHQKAYSNSLLSVLAQHNQLSFAPKLLCMVDGKKNIERRLRMIKLG